MGAYTGETSYKHLADFGVKWTLVGHSEWRTLYHETNQEVGKKCKIALENDLSIVLCIGETLKERE